MTTTRVHSPAAISAEHHQQKMKPAHVGTIAHFDPSNGGRFPSAIMEAVAKQEAADPAKSERFKREASFRAKLSEAFCFGDKRRNKKILDNLAKINFGSVHYIEMRYIGYAREYIRRDSKNIWLSGTQCIAQMARVYRGRHMSSARTMAGMKESEANDSRTWKRMEFEVVLVNFFMLLASHVPAITTIKGSDEPLTEEDKTAVEEEAINLICQALKNFK